jgi:hypothetical protein
VLAVVSTEAIAFCDLSLIRNIDGMHFVTTAIHAREIVCDGAASSADFEQSTPV